jgi:hypothetical protein
LPNHVLLRLAETISLANGYKLVNSGARRRFFVRHTQGPTMSPNRAKNRRQPARVIRFSDRGCNVCPKNMIMAHFRRPQGLRVRFAAIYSSHCLRNWFANKAMNERPKRWWFEGALYATGSGIEADLL